MQDNVNKALAYKATHTWLETTAWFKNVVRSNADAHLPIYESMDYKQLDSKYAPFGNFNYGVIGKALGIPDIVLKIGAGAAQIVSDRSTKENPISFEYAGLLALKTKNFGDNPEDQIQIQNGFNAYKIGDSEDLPLQGEISAWLDLYFQPNFLGPTNPTSSTTSQFNLNINPNLVTPKFSTPTDPTQSISSNNNTLLSGGGYSVTGVGNVNVASSITAWLNNSITGNFRPGADQLALPAPTQTLSQMIDQSFSVSALTNAFNNATRGFNLYTPTDPLLLDLNGDGVHLTDYGSNPVLFDIDHDGGTLEQTGWVSASLSNYVFLKNSNWIL